MTRTCIAALAALSLAGPALAAEWTEPYFGVGSADDHAAACSQARDHAQGNSFRACVQRQGKRTDAVYTSCVCSAAGDRMHVCNVNLKVSCDGPTQGSDPGSLPQEGGPKGRAGRRHDAPAKVLHGRADRPGPKVSRLRVAG